MARNREFYRDTSSLGWSILFPFLIIAGFSMMFTDNGRNMYKVGVVNNSAPVAVNVAKQYAQFKNSRFLDFITMEDQEKAISKLSHHSLDMVIKPDSGEYWVSDSSPSAYIVEKMLFSDLGERKNGFQKKTVRGREVPYVEWLFPGVLGMNMMFSGLFGVGYVVVRYRKNGVLKRLSVTPMRPYEYLTSQVLSRVVTMLATTAIVYLGCALLYGFKCRGSYALLTLVFFLGSFAMISMGLLVAARISSEELAGGLLNLISWPMMFLSGVWFSLEGSKPWVKSMANTFPLTHLIESARKIMNEGAGFYEIRYDLLNLMAMSILFLFLGSVLFEWKKD